ncbi:transaldolase [Mycobacterium tuberculosis]|nr:transaldolase [Mycobacterium tuberculosis]
MTQNPSLAGLSAAGISVWLDDLSDDLPQSGKLQRLIDTRSVVGVTTNPSTFERALTHGHAYDRQIAKLTARGTDMETAVRTAITDDVRAAVMCCADSGRSPTASTEGCPLKSIRRWRTTPMRQSRRPSS